jgi:hypothetical protein
MKALVAPPVSPPREKGQTKPAHRSLRAIGDDLPLLSRRHSCDQAVYDGNAEQITGSQAM